MNLHDTIEANTDEVSHLSILESTEADIRSNLLLSAQQLKKAERLLASEEMVLLSQSESCIRVAIEKDDQSRIIELIINHETVSPVEENAILDWDEYSYAALRLFISNYDWCANLEDGKKYSREGMVRRVLEERADKASKAKYKIKLAKNLYGEHTLINEKGQKYLITLWDFEKRTGYVDNIDWRTNKLATTKHIMYLYNYLESHPRKLKKLKDEFPFIEITLDPLNDYQITWMFPNKLSKAEQKLIKKHFSNSRYISDEKIPKFISFFLESDALERIKIRPEVFEKVEIHINKTVASSILENNTLDYSKLKLDLMPYQREGVEFIIPKTGCIIADEMGLGKTAQAIASIIFKKDLFGFERNLVICPASLKYQWKKEIEKFSDLEANVITGKPADRYKAYQSNDQDVHIINYELVLKDLDELNKAGYHYIILDEAQKIKNFNTKTAICIKKLKKEHSLVITGTPIENKINDLYSIIQFVDPYKLTPLWEFSYQHCIFSNSSKSKINGYYDLKKLKSEVSDILKRREKRHVINELPNVIEKNIYVSLTERQQEIHTGYSGSLGKILAKKFKTTFDWQRIMMILNSMRMVCDSTYLIDKETHNSSKLEELEDILINRLNLKNNDRKVIIFSEWVTMLHLIGERLKKIGLGFTMLTGKVPVKKRGQLIEEFSSNKDCRVFLSSEAGGAGLNLQVADVLINFELPWNPAKKNQRIGRIDRLGQTSSKLSIFNLIATDSIELKIMTGLMLKQNIFDGVLNKNNDIDIVDLSQKGRADFLRGLEEMVEDMDDDQLFEENIWEEDIDLEDTLTIIEEEATHSSDDKKKEAEKVEEILNKGLSFLSSIYEMSSGKKLNASDEKSISVDKETGEVTLKFKIDL